MTDTSAILASLDRFIDQFARHRKLINDHRAATQNQPVAIMNLLRNEDNNHPGHSGHPKQETVAGADKERCDPHSSPAENSEAGLGRRVLSVDCYSGQSGKSFQNQGLAAGHRETASGQSGNSTFDQQVAGGLTSPDNHSGQKLISPVDTFQSGPAWWRDQYEERTRHRELGGRRCRAEAQRLAWGELRWCWHKQHGERVPSGICGGCQKPIRAAENIPLIDRTYVHDGDGHDCLITYGRRWRDAATNALVAMGLTRPPEETP